MRAPIDKWLSFVPIPPEVAPVKSDAPSDSNGLTHDRADGKRESAVVLFACWRSEMC